MSAAADAEAVNVNEGFIPAGTRKSERHCCTSKKRDKAEVMSSRCDITQMHIPGHDDMRMNSFCLGSRASLCVLFHVYFEWKTGADDDDISKQHKNEHIIVIAVIVLQVSRHPCTSTEQRGHIPLEPPSYI